MCITECEIRGEKSSELEVKMEYVSELFLYSTSGSFRSALVSL